MNFIFRLVYSDENVLLSGYLLVEIIWNNSFLLHATTNFLSLRTRVTVKRQLSESSLQTKTSLSAVKRPSLDGQSNFTFEIELKETSSQTWPWLNAKLNGDDLECSWKNTQKNCLHSSLLSRQGFWERKWIFMGLKSKNLLSYDFIAKWRSIRTLSNTGSNHIYYLENGC